MLQAAKACFFVLPKHFKSKKQTESGALDMFVTKAFEERKVCYGANGAREELAY